jgi:hypothetical protein
VNFFLKFFKKVSNLDAQIVENEVFFLGNLFYVLTSCSKPARLPFLIIAKPMQLFPSLGSFMMIFNHFWSFMTLMNDLFDDVQPILVVHDLDERPF